MTEKPNWLAQQFEEKRAHLRAVAYRMLGSQAEADDAVQEAWLRLSRSAADEIENLGAWLTTVVSRVCLDVLRARKTRGERSLAEAPEAVVVGTDQRAPDAEVRLAESVGAAMLIVLELLAPAERVAFVLHDMFDLPFDQIAPIVGRSETATRQLASRARRRVRGEREERGADTTRQREMVAAFLAAARDGDLAALLALLDPDVVLRADAAAVAVSEARQGHGAPLLESESSGAATVAEAFKGRARAARLVLVDGVPAGAWAPKGVPRALFTFEFEADRIVAVEVLMDPVHIAELEVELL